MFEAVNRAQVERQEQPSSATASVLPDPGGGFDMRQIVPQPYLLAPLSLPPFPVVHYDDAYYIKQRPTKGMTAYLEYHRPSMSTATAIHTTMQRPKQPASLPSIADLQLGQFLSRGSRNTDDNRASLSPLKSSSRLQNLLSQGDATAMANAMIKSTGNVCADSLAPSPFPPPGLTENRNAQTSVPEGLSSGNVETVSSYEHHGPTILFTREKQVGQQVCHYPAVTVPDRKRETTDLGPPRKRQRFPRTKPEGYTHARDEDITRFKEKILGTREVDGAEYYLVVCPVLIWEKCVKESLLSEHNEAETHH